MGVELIGQYSHDSVGDFLKPKGTEKNNNFTSGEKAADVPSDDNSVKAGVLKFDI